MMFEARPSDPTMTTRRGFETSVMYGCDCQLATPSALLTRGRSHWSDGKCCFASITLDTPCKNFRRHPDPLFLTILCVPLLSHLSLRLLAFPLCLFVYVCAMGLTGDIDNTLDRLHKDAEAQGEQEDAVDERAEDLCALPAIRVLCVLL